MVQDWIRELQPGDKVLVRPGYEWSDKLVVGTVARLTDRQVILEDGKRFWKDGAVSPSGGDWHRSHIYEATPEALAEVEAKAETDRRKAIVRRLAAAYSQLKVPEDDAKLAQLIEVMTQAAKDVAAILKEGS